MQLPTMNRAVEMCQENTLQDSQEFSKDFIPTSRSFSRSAFWLAEAKTMRLCQIVKCPTTPEVRSVNETCEEIVRRDSQRSIFDDPRHMAVRNSVRGGAPVAVVIKIGVHKTRKVLTRRIQTTL
jgi:hypothetical protein